MLGSLDESMFEEITEIAENSAYLRAVEEKDVSLEMIEMLPKYETFPVQRFEQQLREAGKLTFNTIMREPIGYYFIKCFLTADYAVEKALFLNDVERYKAMRFESARKKIARLIYQRFVSIEPGAADAVIQGGKTNLSVFDIIRQQKPDEKRHTLEPSHATQTRLQFDRSAVGTGFSSLRAPSMSGMASPTQMSIASPNGVSIDRKSENMFQIGFHNNSIGIYGKPVRIIKEKVESSQAPTNLFDTVAHDVLMDLKLDVFPRFLKSDFFKRYIRAKFIETVPVTVKDFTTFRALGRGGFGAVHACRKKNCGTIYAMKCINKKLVKVKSALENVLEERNVLTIMQSPFITNLKYALQDEESLYLIMDLMLGGDLKFHLINAGRFTEKRARFYAAQVLLGLEAIHKQHILFRDVKLENVLLDNHGNCRISDLGLSVVTKVKIKGYAGTPGYTAPEMIRNKLYGNSVDIFSFGVMLYRMLCGSKPFKGKFDRDLDKAVIEKKPQFPKEIFSADATSLLTGLLAKRVESRLGCGERGIEEIKEHPFFEGIDWGLLEAGYIDPPFVPNKYDVNAASLKDIGDFDRAKYRSVRLDDMFRARVKNFQFINKLSLHEEMTSVLEKQDEHTTFEKFSHSNPVNVPALSRTPRSCCTIL